MEALKRELNNLQEKLNFVFDPEILTKINAEISFLNKNGESIPLMRTNCKEKDLHQLADLISERLIDLNYEAKTYQKKSATLDAAITGNNMSNTHVERYFATKEKINHLNENEKEAANQTLSSFEYFAKKELEIDLHNLEKAELKKMIEAENNALKAKINHTEKLILSFEKTKAYKENLLPFIKYDELKRAQEKMLENLAFLQEKVAPTLEKERKQLSAYLEKQIASFFHGKLINMLFRKIDPHPKYKTISFQCDFSDETPQLNMFVAGENGDAPLVPTSYFSAAQLNILSLSILLAKALNVKDNRGNPVECIFIDDPIQSMESINVLSTIDLLRSIVVNLGKQIILATHDENFRNLLQKKIPSDKFKAKYIELETFGKVKQ